MGDSGPAKDNSPAPETLRNTPHDVGRELEISSCPRSVPQDFHPPSWHKSRQHQAWDCNCGSYTPVVAK